MFVISWIIWCKGWTVCLGLGVYIFTNPRVHVDSWAAAMEGGMRRRSDSQQSSPVARGFVQPTLSEINMRKKIYDVFSKGKFYGY